jgi:hypothetical protein
VRASPPADALPPRQPMRRRPDPRELPPPVFPAGQAVDVPICSVAEDGTGARTTRNRAKSGSYSRRDPPPYYYDSSQLADGTWYTWVAENCQGYY